MNFLDEGTIRVRDKEAHVRVAADQGAHSRSRQLGDVIAGVTLAAILEPHGEHQRDARGAARGGEDAHFAARGLEPQIQWITADRRCTGVRGVGDGLLPLRQPGMHGRDGLEALFLAGGLIQPRIALGGIAPEQAGEMRDPGGIDLRPVERLHQRIG